MEKNRSLIKALIIASSLILLLCLLATFFAIKTAEDPEYGENDVELMMASLDGTIQTLDKKQKAIIETMFSLEKMEKIMFKRSEDKLELILSDERVFYIFPFSYRDKSLSYEKDGKRVKIFLIEETIIIKSGEQTMEFTL